MGLRCVLGPLAILAVVLSSLQSFRAAHAADVACGSIAVFGPAPLVVAQSTNLLTVTRLNQDATKVYRVHGNLDDTCADAYTITLASPTTEVSREAELTAFKGSEVYKVCSSDLGYATACSVPRLVPFFNPRQGAWKDTMLGATPVPVWSAPAASVGASFTLIIHGGTQSYTTLVSAGNEFWLGLSAERSCDALAVQYAWNQVTVTSASLAVTVPALSAGVYTICMAVARDGVLLSDHFPLSAILGHSVHNLRIGVPNTDVGWELSPVYGQRLQYQSLPMSDVTLVVESSVLTDGWTHFGIDTSADICSPLLEVSFDSSQLLPFNATHVQVETSVARPYGNPGGGRAVLCGARGPSAPWQLLSTSHYWPWIYACPDGYGVVLPTDSNTCYSCPPNGLTPCNNNGNCGVFENKTIARSSAVCVCLPRYYTSSCGSYDLYPPSVFPLPGTYKTKHLIVTIQKPSTASKALLSFMDGSQFVCSAPSCSLTFSAYTRFTMKSLAANGSSSLAQPWLTYAVLPPTESPTLSVTGSFTSSLHRSSTLSADERKSASDTELTFGTQTRTTASKTVSASIASESQLRLPHTASASMGQPFATPPNAEWRTSSSRSRSSHTVPESLTQTPTAAFDSDLPAQTSIVITLTAAQNYVAELPNQPALRRVLCEVGSCSNGLHFSCSNLSVAAAFVAPEPHYCNATFRSVSNRSASYSWEVRVEPVPIARDNLLFLFNPRVAALYRYRAATIPYLVTSQEVLLRGCASDIWSQDPVHLRAQQGCVVARASASGFSSLLTTIRDDAAQAVDFNSDAVPQFMAETALSARLLATKNPSPGGLFLGVAFGILSILTAVSFA